MVGTVTGVTIASPPVVTFKLTTAQGVPVVGFGSTSKSSTATVASYPNLAFSIAKLVPATASTPSKWVNYIVTTVPTTTAPAAPTRPSTDNTGTLVDKGDGTYTYTFYRDITTIKQQVDGMTVAAPNNKADLGDLTYVPTATHRLSIQISGAAPGTGTNTANGVQVTPAVNLTKPVDVIYDFVPATGQAPAASANRKMVNNDNCESCHSTLGGIPGDENTLSFHGGSRNTIEYCVICHTDQRGYGRTEATYDAATRKFTGSTYKVDGRTVGSAPNYIHKIHVGGVMTKTGYDYGGVKLDEGGYSQDIRNCEKCHNPANASTPQAAQWKDNPNRQACGSCHDGINFDSGTGLTLGDKAKGLTTSTGFFGGAHPSNALDGSCSNASCHGVGSPGNPDLVHLPVTPPNAMNSLQVDAAAGGNSNTNAAWIASNTTRLPAGAIKVVWDVKSVSLDAARHPVMVFRWLQNGVATPLLDFASAPVNAGSQEKEMWANFMGSPSAYWVWAEPQDNNNNPADFNKSTSVYLRNAWNTPAGADQLTGPDANGYYTITRTTFVVPPTAKMLTGGMGYSYNARTSLPLTQTNLPAYPVTKTTLTVGITAGMPNAWGGLIVIAPNKQVVASGFTARRPIVEDARCNSCHQELGTFTEDAFHAGQRNDGTTCSWCHKPTLSNNGWSVDSTAFVHAIHGSSKRAVKFNYHGIDYSKIVYPGVLARCEQCHLPGSYDFTLGASADAAGLGADQVDKRLIREAAKDTVTDDSATNPPLGSKSPWVPAAAAGTYGASGADTNLVHSPTVAVCSSCHDSNLAVSHMKANGGTFYGARTQAKATTEQCFICHASGKTADIKAVHAR